MLPTVTALTVTRTRVSRPPRAPGVCSCSVTLPVHGLARPAPMNVACRLMISFVLGVDDLAGTRFALSPVHETLFSLRVLREPGLSAVHLPWRRNALARLGGLD